MINALLLITPKELGDNYYLLISLEVASGKFDWVDDLLFESSRNFWRLPMFRTARNSVELVLSFDPRHESLIAGTHTCPDLLCDCPQSTTLDALVVLGAPSLAASVANSGPPRALDRSRSRCGCDLIFVGSRHDHQRLSVRLSVCFFFPRHHRLLLHRFCFSVSYLPF